MFEHKKISIQNIKGVFQEILIILGLLSFFFLWDIKLNIYKDFIFSLRELFYLLFFLLLLDYKNFFQFKLIKYLFFFSIFLFYNFYVFEFNINLLDIRYNIIPLFFVFLIFLICVHHKHQLLNKLYITFIIFIFIFSLSFLFGEIYYLNFNEKSRVCGLAGIKIINQNIFLNRPKIFIKLYIFNNLLWESF